MADRLSTLMVALTSVLGGCALIFALARWDRAGPRFHALFLLLVMGVNGALLTGDLFNLFVFFEIMLAASYGLAAARVGRGACSGRRGLYRRQSDGVLAVPDRRQPDLRRDRHAQHGRRCQRGLRPSQRHDRGLFHVGAAMLGVAFLIKCAMWPLGFWLTATYSAASAPAAAVFAILVQGRGLCDHPPKPAVVWRRRGRLRRVWP
ncbi:MAG: proton-conducting transporter transmembrane domain-containing protein [Stenotrophomonas sp.]